MARLSGLKHWALRGGLAAALLAGGPLVAQMNPTSNPAGSLPPGEGKELVAEACSQCHGLGMIMTLRDGEAGWKRYVQEMVMRGAQLNAQEGETVTRYLVKNFGPDAGRAPGETGAASLPAGPGKDLVQTRCIACHTLARITTSQRSSAEWERTVEDMVSRGAAVSSAEAQTITSYLTAQFGRKGE